jgi:hypothetical protein
VTSANARGGAWKTHADARLGTVLTLLDSTREQISQLTAELGPLQATIAARDDESDGLLGRVSDVIWNEVGRPGSDPALSTLFPGGIGYYTNGSTEEQPARMDLLAVLLVSGAHPRLPTTTATALAKEVQDSATLLRRAVDAARTPLARLEQLRLVQRAMARNAQSELQNLKRQYKAENMTEADIHTVIPDRPRPGPAASQTTASQTAGAAKGPSRS